MPRHAVQFALCFLFALSAAPAIRAQQIPDTGFDVSVASPAFVKRSMERHSQRRRFW